MPFAVSRVKGVAEQDQGSKDVLDLKIEIFVALVS